VRLTRATSLLLAGLAAGGCAVLPPRSLRPAADARVLPGVEVQSFGVKSCGAGSLAIVLRAYGDKVTFAELETALPRGRNDGVLTLDLLLEARRRGYEARLLEGTPELVRGELLAGRPVILMLKVLDAPGLAHDYFHYIVADGIDPKQGLVRVQFGDQAPRWTTFERLDKAWRPTRYTTLLIAPGKEGGEPVAAANMLRYAVALEEAGRAEEAVALYRKLLEETPDSPLVWTDLGNAEAGRKEWALAEAAYRQAITLDPANADALNNLAWLLLEHGEHDRLAEAEELARRAVAAAGADRHLPLDTLAQVLRKEGRCAEAASAFAEAAAAAPAGTPEEERLSLTAALTRRDCGDSAWRQALEELLAAARDPEVVAQARRALATGTAGGEPPPSQPPQQRR
jgi:Flp pilus assembly protein TadD